MADETVRYADELEALVGSEPPPRKNIWKSPKFLAMTTGGILVVAVISLLIWLHFQGRVSTDNAQVDGHIIPIASKVYGTVSEVLVTDNQFVKKGQVLVRIDPRDYQAKVDQVKAALALAQSQARAANAGVPLTRATTLSGTSEAEAQVGAASADVAKAQTEYQRSSTADIAAAQAAVESA